MTTDQFERGMAQQMLDAEARNQLTNLVTEHREEVLNGETRNEASRLGLGTSATKSSNDADRYVKLYHAYDDREVSVPLYMAPNRLTLRFVQGDQEVQPEFWGTQVWLLANDTRRRPAEPRTYQCRLSPKAAPDHLAEINAAGLVANCRLSPKGGGFMTQFQADEHFRIKHPRRWTAYQRSLEAQRSTRSADSVKDAMNQFAEVLMSRMAPAPESTPEPAAKAARTAPKE